MKLTIAALILASFCYAQTITPPSGSGGLTVATFASPPSSPAVNQAFLFVDASGSGVCGGGGTAAAICYWTGSAFAATSGTSTGLGDPGSNGVVFRNGAGTSVVATATQMSGPNFCADAGATDAYACNLAPAIGSYATGTLYWFKANTANAGASSINFNGKGALPIKTINGNITTDTITGDILAGQWVAVLYDGTNAEMASQRGTTVDLSSTQTLTNKTIDGVPPATMVFIDPTSSIQTQLNGKQASLGYTAENTANKGAASGYAPLDASSLVPLANIPTPLTGKTAALATALAGGAANDIPVQTGSGATGFVTPVNNGFLITSALGVPSELASIATCTAGQFSTGFTLASGIFSQNCGTPAGAGNVSNSGTPTAGQLASWTSATVIQGITANGAAVGLGSVTNDAQTKAAVVPNTPPSAGQILVGNAGGTAYAPVSISGAFTLSSAGAATIAAVVNPATGYEIGGAATSAHYLRGNGTNYVDSAIQAADVPALSTTTALGGLTVPSSAGSATFGQTIASGTSALGTSAIASGACASVVTTAATGVATTDVIVYTPNADPTGVTGYAVSASGSLYIWAYPTSGNVNFKVCNNTSGSITPSALTLNWRVGR